MPYMDFKLTESDYRFETKDKKYNLTIGGNNELSLVEIDKITKDVYSVFVGFDLDEFVTVMEAVLNLAKSLHKKKYEQKDSN